MKASRKALLLGLCMAASAVAVPTIASAGVSVDIDIAPPPLRVETVPPPRVGFVWAPGYWDYRGHDHVGSRAAGFTSAGDIIGFRIVGNNADRIGTTSRGIGSVKFPIERLTELRRGLERDAPQFFY